MKQITNFIWESEGEVKNPCSIVLQQAFCGKNGYLLGCIFDSMMPGDYDCEAGGYFTRELGEWFHNCCLPNRKNPVNCFRLLEQKQSNLEKETEDRFRMEDSAFDFSYIIWLSLGDKFYYAKKGTCLGQLFYKRFDQLKYKDILTDNGLLKGSCQKGAVILLSNAAFEQGIEKQALMESLNSGRIQNKEQLKKYMEELCKEAKLKGENAPKSAIAILMKD